jgi:hypothetical protein
MSDLCLDVLPCLALTRVVSSAVLVTYSLERLDTGPA